MAIPPIPLGGVRPQPAIPQTEDDYLAALFQLDQEQAAQPPDPTFSGGATPGFLERFGTALQGGVPQAPGAVGSFISGLAGSLAGQGQKVAAQRAQFEQTMEQRRRERDAQNLEASREKRRLLIAGLNENRAETRRLEREARDRANIEQDRYLETKGRLRAESEIVNPREARAQEAADRQVKAAERQAKLAEVNSVSKLSDDYRVDPDIAAYRGATQNLTTMESAAKQKSGVGDLALLISYVRATEPGVLSVVRQEELGNVQSAVGALQKYINIPRQWVSGQRLTDSGRQSILAAGRQITESRRPAYETATGQFRDRAAAFGVDPGLVLRDYAPAQADAVADPLRVETPGGVFTFKDAASAARFRQKAGL